MHRNSLDFHLQLMLHWSSKFVLFLRRLIKWIFKSTCFSLQQRKQSTEWKGNIQNGRKHLQTTYEIRDWYVEYINDSYNSLTENQITQLKNSQMTWKDISPKNIHKGPLSMKRCSSSTNYQGNANQNYKLLLLPHTLQNRHYQKIIVGKQVKKLDHLHIAARTVKWCLSYGK